MLYLPHVTLLQVDTVDIDRAHKAMLHSQEHIAFGKTVLLGALDLPHVTNYAAYNKFEVLELYKYFDTTHCLLIQHDGFVMRPFSWTDEFLRYDYIGAPWRDGVVGNGGFSLRSKKFCKLTSRLIGEDGNYAPGDVFVCREHRYILEFAGANFAPEAIARRFSWELDDKYPAFENQFGFHGMHTLERLIAEKQLPIHWIHASNKPQR